MNKAEVSYFVGEAITVEFDEPPVFEKRPHCPNRFLWRGEVYTVTQSVQEWVDFERRGRMAENMRPENAQRARVKGSWGVGRFFFRVQVHTGRVFDLYYDRAPQGLDKRKGQWQLYCEWVEAP